jgi:amino acid transporter
MFGGMAVSIGGNIAGALFSSPRITYALGLDGRLPAWFAAVSPRFGTPAVSIGVFGVTVFALAAGGTFVWLAGLSVLAGVYFIFASRHCRSCADVTQAAGVMRLAGGLLIPCTAVSFASRC